MTNEELKERAEIYIQLLEFPAFKYYLRELTELHTVIGDGILENMRRDDDSFFDKGRREGISTALNHAMDAVDEYNGSFTKRNKTIKTENS